MIRWRDEEQSHEYILQRDEKRTMERSGNDIHSIPMTIAGCTKRHLTISGSIPKFEFKRWTRSEWNSGLREDLCWKFSVQRLGGLTEKKDDRASGTERCIMALEAYQPDENAENRFMAWFSVSRPSSRWSFNFLSNVMHSRIFLFAKRQRKKSMSDV